LKNLRRPALNLRMDDVCRPFSGNTLNSLQSMRARGSHGKSRLENPQDFARYSSRCKVNPVFLRLFAIPLLASILLAPSAGKKTSLPKQVSAPQPAPRRSFEVVLLEAASETSANASIGDVNGDGYPDIVLAKGRHWPVPSRVLLGDGRGHFSPGPDLPSEFVHI
jgi:hypothetical protein